MKNLKLMIAMTLLSLVAFSCAPKESSSTGEDPTIADVPLAPPAQDNPLLPGIPGGSQSPTTEGTVAFVPVSKAMMEAYIGNSHPLNDPKNFRISVSLKHVGDLRYGGEVRIMYEDNAITGQYQTHTGIFKAPEGKNEAYPSKGYNQDVGLYKSHYNYWFNYNGNLAFTGFFEDLYGGIVLVIDNAINLGDGQGGGTVSGSIWFKNFNRSYAPYSTERNCWFIYMGPYDCRSTTIINKSSLEPSDGYRKLGTFSGLVKSQILN